MKDFINWAILAPGNIAESMAYAMKSTGEKIHLYAVGSRNLQKAKEFARKWGFEKYYGSYEDLLADKNVDAVYISNPHAFHFDSVMKCFDYGKHVLCEKPAGCNLTQLNKMISTAASKKLFFMEAMWTAFNPCIQKQIQWIENGRIGELKHIQSYFCNRVPFDKNSRLWNPDLAGGSLLDLGIYNIFYSMIINNFSPIINHSSSVKMLNQVDSWNSVDLIFKNGVTASFNSSCEIPNNSPTHDATIYGTKGFITSKNFFMAQEADLHIYTSEWGSQNKIEETIKEPFKVNGYEYELIDATECILQGKISSTIHSHQHSIDLCTIMDELRKDWNFKYPFES